MPSTASRLVLIDQSLTGFAGHHYEYDLAVLRAASALRLGVSLAVHHDFSEGSLAGAPVVGRFAAGWNEAHHRGWVRRARRALGQMPSWLRLPLLRMAKWVPRDKVLPAKAGMPASPFGTTLAAIIAEQKLTEHDHLLVHTLSGGEFVALVTALARQASLPHIHLVFRYDIEENASAQSDFKIGLKTMTSDALLLRCCHFYSYTEPLAKLYRRLGAAEVTVLPIPHCLRPPSERKEKDGPLTHVYLGGARGDKGYDRLPGLVDALAEDYLKTGRARFIIQSNYGISLEEPQMARARRSLAAWPANMVELIDGPLDTAAFHTRLFNADIVLLPYRAELYRRRSAEILVQAAAAGIPTVVPALTWLSSEAPPGGHLTFSCVSSLADATHMALENYPSLRAGAMASALKMRAKHDATKLVHLLMDSASASTT